MSQCPFSPGVPVVIMDLEDVTTLVVEGYHPSATTYKLPYLATDRSGKRDGWRE